MALLLALPFVFAVLSYLLYKHIIHPAFISPLSKIPQAHPTAFLPTWIWWHRRAGRESRTIHAAHERKGPTVRLGPDEVSVNSLDGIRKVYVGGLERTDWFLPFRNYDNTPNLVTLFDGKAHARRKRMLTHIYSKSYLLDSKDFQVLARNLLFERFLPALGRNEAAEGFNVVDLAFASSAEFMSAYAMGLGNGLDLVKIGKEEEMTRYVDNGRKKLRNPKGCKDAIKELEEQCWEMCEKAKDQLANNGDAPVAESMRTSSRTHPVVYAQLSESLRASEQDETTQNIDRLIASELIDSIEAAREGIGITLVYAMYELSKQPVLQNTLYEKLSTLDNPLTCSNQPQLSTSTLRQLDHIPLLEAILTETLRLHAPAQIPQRRSVPRDGVIIEGHYIPGGVTISSSPYTMHRHEGAFPTAEMWKPERWMNLRNLKDDKPSSGDVKDADLEEMMIENDPRRWFFTFGRGGRMCIGSNFATLVSKLMLASIYSNYTTTIINDEGIEHRDEMMAAPVGDKLILKFDRV